MIVARSGRPHRTERSAMTVLHAARGWEDLLEAATRDHLEREALPAFLRRQRWFAGKARELDAVRIVEATHPDGFPEASALALIEVRYREGGPDTYFLPLTLADGVEAARLIREAP